MSMKLAMTVSVNAIDVHRWSCLIQLLIGASQFELFLVLRAQPLLLGDLPQACARKWRAVSRPRRTSPAAACPRLDREISAARAETPGPRHQCPGELPDERSRCLVVETTVFVEALGRVRDHDFGPVHRVHVEKHERLAQMILRPRRPVAPTDAPMTATDFPSHALSPCGREAQSIAFFSTPG